MDHEVAARKAALRTAVRRARADLTPAERAAESAAAVRRLLTLPTVRRAPIVLLYAATAEEIDPLGILPELREHGQRVALPRVSGRDLDVVVVTDLGHLRPGRLGILEPTGPAVDLDLVECVIAPGLAFDLDGGRVGHGVGYYDRLLARLPDDTLRIGLAFSCQVVPRVPVEAHDEVLDVVVTSHAIHWTGARRPEWDA